MACFPMMVEIEGRTLLVIGGGRIALHKIKVLLPFGADIVAISDDFLPEFFALAKDNENITLIQKSISGDSRTSFEDLLDESDRDICFVIAATDDIKLQDVISGVCKDRKIPVNVVDVKDKSSFYFPAVIKKDELVVAVSTGGASPTLAGHIKNKLDGIIPEYYKDMTATLGKMRDRALLEISSYGDRKKFFEELIAYGEEHEGMIPDDIAESCLKKYR